MPVLGERFFCRLQKSKWSFFLKERSKNVSFEHTRQIAVNLLSEDCKPSGTNEPRAAAIFYGGIAGVAVGRGCMLRNRWRSERTAHAELLS